MDTDNMAVEKYPHQELTREIVGSAFEVHNQLGQRCRRGLAKISLLCLTGVLVMQAEAFAQMRVGDYESL